MRNRAVIDLGSCPCAATLMHLSCIAMVAFYMASIMYIVPIVHMQLNLDDLELNCF